MTNPMNGDLVNLLDTGETNFSNFIGQLTFTPTQPITYSYGTNIFTQIAPIYYDGKNFALGKPYNPTAYI